MSAFRPGSGSQSLAAVFREFPAEDTEEPAVKPVHIQAHGQGALHQRQADEEGEAGEQRELQLRGRPHMTARPPETMNQQCCGLFF